MTHGLIVEYSHSDNQPNHRLKGEFTFTQGDGISERKSLLNEVKVSEALNVVGCSKIDTRACESSILKGSMLNMNPFYTSLRIGHLILKRSALTFRGAFLCQKFNQKWIVIRCPCHQNRSISDGKTTIKNKIQRPTKSTATVIDSKFNLL